MRVAAHGNLQAEIVTWRAGAILQQQVVTCIVGPLYIMEKKVERLNNIRKLGVTIGACVLSCRHTYMRIIFASRELSHKPQTDY